MGGSARSYPLGTLEELHGVLKRVKTEIVTRPLLLDNLNTKVPGTLEELHGVLLGLQDRGTATHRSPA